MSGADALTITLIIIGAVVCSLGVALKRRELMVIAVWICIWAVLNAFFALGS